MNATITWTSVDQDLQRHMASLDPNDLITFWLLSFIAFIVLSYLNPGFERQFTSCCIMLAFGFCHIGVSNMVCYFISIDFSYYFWLNRNDINPSRHCCCPVKPLNICPIVWDLTYTKANRDQRASFVWDPCRVNGRSQSLTVLITALLIHLFRLTLCRVLKCYYLVN